MGKIIAFAGRCRAGKSELARVCEKYGYEKLYFALPLKQLCADLMDTTIDELNQAKADRTEINITIGKDMCTIISEETNIPFDVVYEKCNGVVIKDVRHLLQFIGTDIIREYNQDWHVNRIQEMIRDDVDYVFDDVRFPNEKKMIEDLGGDCWFVVRPQIDNVSNHESETSIKFQDCFNKIIINNSTLDALLFKWEVFMDNYQRSCSIRDKELERILENGFKNRGIEPISITNCLMISKEMFEYEPIDINEDDIDNMSMTTSNMLKINLKNKTSIIVENPLVIEDMKKYIK